MHISVSLVTVFIFGVVVVVEHKHPHVLLLIIVGLLDRTSCSGIVGYPSGTIRCHAASTCWRQKITAGVRSIGGDSIHME